MFFSKLRFLAEIYKFTPFSFSYNDPKIRHCNAIEVLDYCNLITVFKSKVRDYKSQFMLYETEILFVRVSKQSRKRVRRHGNREARRLPDNTECLMLGSTEINLTW